MPQRFPCRSWPTPHKLYIQRPILPLCWILSGSYLKHWLLEPSSFSLQIFNFFFLTLAVAVFISGEEAYLHNTLSKNPAEESYMIWSFYGITKQCCCLNFWWPKTKRHDNTTLKGLLLDMFSPFQHQTYHHSSIKWSVRILVFTTAHFLGLFCYQLPQQ